MSRKRPSMNFEASLAELEALVDRLEGGELSLEESLAAFEKGIELTRLCQKSLREAEQKVEMLTEKNGELVSEPFQPGENADDD